jgi:ABC-type uncharacterized transport system substrate-binding protein
MLNFIESVIAERHKRKVLKSKNIAVLQSDNYASSHLTYLGFIFGIGERTEQRYTFTSLNAAGNRERLYENVLVCTQADFRLIFCLGYEATTMLRDVLVGTRKIDHFKTPILFTDVKDPIRLQLTSSRIDGHSNVVGVLEDRNIIEPYVKTILQVQPHIKNVLLPYNPHHEFGLIQDEREQVISLFEAQGIGVRPLEIFDFDDSQAIYNTIDEALKGPIKPDIIMTLRDSVVMQYMPLIGMLGNENEVPVFAGDLGAAAEGASFAYGYPDNLRGKECARVALEIMQQADIEPRPMRHGSLNMQQCKLLINRTIMRMQGAHLTDEVNGWLRNAAEEAW